MPGGRVGEELVTDSRNFSCPEFFGGESAVFPHFLLLMLVLVPFLPP